MFLCIPNPRIIFLIYTPSVRKKRSHKTVALLDDPIVYHTVYEESCNSRYQVYGIIILV